MWFIRHMQTNSFCSEEVLFLLPGLAALLVLGRACLERASPLAQLSLDIAPADSGTKSQCLQNRRTGHFLARTRIFPPTRTGRMKKAIEKVHQYCTSVVYAIAQQTWTRSNRCSKASQRVSDHHFALYSPSLHIIDTSCLHL